MPGLGRAPCGKFSCGFGVPDEGTPLVAPTLKGARRIDSVTRDFVVDAASGHFEQATSAEQVILLKVGSRKGSSSALPNYGAALPLDLGDNTEREVRQEIMATMKPEIDAGVLTIESIRLIVEENVTGGRASIEIRWVDLTTGNPGTTTLNA